MPTIDRVRSSVFVTAIVGTLLAACGEDPVGPILTDGVLATFVAAGDTFKVWITDSQARSDVVAVWNGESNKTIPDGQLNLGPGSAEYNRPWSWHIDKDNVEMVETADQVCDGTPSEVQANLDEWINDIERFCPGDSRLIFLESF